jgi:hypothetical protein
MSLLRKQNECGKKILLLKSARQLTKNLLLIGWSLFQKKVKKTSFPTKIIAPPLMDARSHLAVHCKIMSD